jgi:iron complex outermembrane receptor protein
MLTYAVPSFQSTHQSVTDGTDHIDPASLRGLGPDQTLVLLNGKRRHNTALVNINGSVGRGSVGTDLNAIPAAAIERIEVLRDGAAAQYGSDAIAGVINIVLKKKFKGFTASVTAGENITSMPYTQYFSGQSAKLRINDGITKQVDFSAGTFTGSGAYINFSGQWLQRDQTNRTGEDNGTLMYIGTSPGGFPSAPAARLPAGVTSNSIPYRDWLMNQDAAMAKTRGFNRRNMIIGQASANNFTGFVNAGIPITSNIDFYLTAGAGHRTGQSEGNYRNASSLSQQPQQPTLNVLGMNANYYVDGFLPEIHTVIIDASLITGFRAKFGSWGLDLSNTYGENDLHYRVEHSANASNAPSFQPQTSFDAGKQAFTQNTLNLDIDRKFNFGFKNSLNLGFGGEYRYETFKLVAGEDASWNRGPLLSDTTIVPAYSGGASYKLSAIPGYGAQVFPGLQPTNELNKNRGIVAGYIDLEYTFDKLLLGAAGRYESYNESSANLTYNGTGTKLTARYEITPNLAVRGSFGTGFRAPSLHQRYYNSTSTQFVNGNPQNSFTANNQDPIVRNAFGIKELKPETSTDYTAGVVGRFGNGFTVSVDGYYIRIKDRIVLSTAFSRGNPGVDAIFAAYSVSPSINSYQFWTNAINTDTRGVDIVVSKRYKLGAGNGNVSLAANFNENSVVGSLHTNSAIDAASNNPSKTDNTKNPANDFSNILFDRQQRARTENGSPKDKVNLTVTYSIGKWDFLVRAVRFGKITQLNTANNDPTAINISTGNYWYDAALASDQVFSAKITTDLVISYKILHGLGISVGATNLFDVYPDKVYVDPRNSYASVYANPVTTNGGTPNVPGAKLTSGYNSGRDQSNRGRFLFTSNQFGYNGRYLFARLNIDFVELSKLHKK